MFFGGIGEDTTEHLLTSTAGGMELKVGVPVGLAEIPALRIAGAYTLSVALPGSCLTSSPFHKITEKLSATKNLSVGLDLEAVKPSIHLKSIIALTPRGNPFSNTARRSGM